MVRELKKLLIGLLLFIPFFVSAETYNFNEAVQEGNGYINLAKYQTRNKYLLLRNDLKFVINNNGVMSYNDKFINGGFLNYREFCLSTGSNSCDNQSYLIIPNAYWTLSGTSTNRYYVNNINGISTKSDNNMFGIRVTEFVKPTSTVAGLGTYSNPWYFVGNYYISLTTNSIKYAKFVETGTNRIEKYANTSCIKGSGYCTNFDLLITHGYENNRIDGCNLNLISKEAIQADGNRIHKYEISNITSDIECVALFVKKVFSISFNCNDGNGSPANKEVRYDDNLVLPGISCSKTGYTQDGWVNNENKKWPLGSTIKFHYDDDQIGIKNKSLSLSATWRVHKYIVQYNGNTNTGGSTATSNHVYDTPKNLTTNGFTKTGYLFGGWATSSNGAIAYSNGQSVKNLTAVDNGVVTLYAKWTPITYTVKYNGNTNTGGSTASSNHVYDTPRNLTTNGFTKTGYLFSGWATSASGGVTYSNSQAVKNLTTTNGGTVNLYAKWTPITYTIKYNGNGATGGSTASSSHTYDVAKNLTANGFSRTGYTFAGWSTSASGGVTYSNSQSVTNLTTTNGGTVNLYAKWNPNYYYIDVNGWLNGGSNGGISGFGTFDMYINGSLVANDVSDYYTQHPYGTSYSITDVRATTGHTYNGVYSGSASGTLGAGNTSTYLSFSSNTYYIYYNANGGYNAPGTTSYTYDAGSNTNLSGGIPSRDYYTFLGWSLSSGASSPSYSAGQAWWRGNNSNYTLYAVWRKNHIYTRYDMNGGYWAGSTNSALGTSGSLITYNGDVNAWIYDYDFNGILNLCNWNNEGYINIKRNDYHAVDGKQWCTGSNGGGTCYNHSTDYNFQNSFANVCNARYGDCIMTLYVHWEKNGGGGGDGYWCPWCGSSCFTAGTKVSTPKGLENIENLRPGDYVYSYNEKTGTYEIDKVEKNYQRLTNEKIYTVYTESDRIKVTPEHPFYVKGKGWVKVKDLKQGDILINNSGKEMPIVKIDISKYNYGSVVYNLMTQKNHTYFAGFDSILVHNKGGCFLAGTKVITKDGYKDIDKIEVGDIVLSYNEITKKNEYNEVTKIFVHDPKDIDDKLYTLTFDDNSIVKATSPHRFYIRRNNKNMWIAAEELKINDEVLYVDGKYHKIIKIICSELKNTVYNFEVKNNHNYYVGKQGILVHNDKYMH